MRAAHTHYVIFGRTSPGRDSTLWAFPAHRFGMAVQTIYCVQPFVRSAGRLAKGHMRRLLSRDAAIRAARGLKGHAAGVVVYRVTGHWEADYWTDPVLIASAGEVPAEAA